MDGMSMIGTLTGQVQSVETETVIVEAGGIGFDVRMPAAELSSLHAGQHVRVFTSLNVSQDSLTLFGFLNADSKRMFLKLQKVSGIGPKVALSVLSVLDPKALVSAVATDDVSALSQAHGLGRKGAQKIILELKGSIDLAQVGEATHSRPVDEGAEQVVAGLVSLGWRQQDASNAVTDVCEANDIATPISTNDVSRVLKLALASLDRGR